MYSSEVDGKAEGEGPRTARAPQSITPPAAATESSPLRSILVDVSWLRDPDPLVRVVT